MGPFHGKLVVHRPSGAVGIASSRRNPHHPKELESWDYSLRCADRSRTPFFPQWELRLANSYHKSRFQESRQAVPSRPSSPRPRIQKRPFGSNRNSGGESLSNPDQPVGRTKSTDAAVASQASSSEALAPRVLRDFSRA